MTDTPTPIDRAHARMVRNPDDAAARLAFHDRLATTELMVLLEREVEDDRVEPRVFPTGTGPAILAFDTEERFAAFVGAPAPWVALPGRALAGMLAGQGAALGLNLGARSETMLDAPTLDWLAAMLAATPERAEARPVAVHPPAGLPHGFLDALDARLGAMPGMARTALLAAAEMGDGTRTHLLALVGAPPEAEAALARAVGEALAFSGLEQGTLDVAFLAPDDALVDRLGRIALRFDLPPAPEPPAVPDRLPGQAPGMDPDKPPKLR